MLKQKNVDQVVSDLIVFKSQHALKAEMKKLGVV